MFSILIPGIIIDPTITHIWDSFLMTKITKIIDSHHLCPDIRLLALKLPGEG